jgi:glycosyltransferase involved in cell wall biosynthesis
MNIVIVSENFYPVLRGGEIAMWKLCNALSKREHKIYVITGNTRKKMLAAETIDNLEIYRPFSEKQSIFGRFIYMIRLYFYLKKFLRFKRIDIICALHYGSFLPATRCAQIYGIPAIMFVHSFAGKVWCKLTNPVSGFLKYLIEEHILRLAKPDVVQVPSQNTKQAISHCVRVPTIVIANPIDIDLIKHVKEQTDVLNIRASLYIREDELFLLFVGSLVPVKNITSLINVLSKLRKKFKLVLVGEGPERRKIEKFIKELGLEGKVILLGQKPHEESLSIIYSSDVLIMPSKSETFSVVVLEGLALGKPVIATRVGAVSEMKSENLYIVDNLEDINRILEKGIEPKEDDNLLKDFSMDKIICEVERLFEGVVNKSEGAKNKNNSMRTKD